MGYWTKDSSKKEHITIMLLCWRQFQLTKLPDSIKANVQLKSGLRGNKFDLDTLSVTMKPARELFSDLSDRSDRVNLTPPLSYRRICWFKLQVFFARSRAGSRLCPNRWIPQTQVVHLQVVAVYSKKSFARANIGWVFEIVNHLRWACPAISEQEMYQVEFNRRSERQQ